MFIGIKIQRNAATASQTITLYFLGLPLFRKNKNIQVITIRFLGFIIYYKNKISQYISNTSHNSLSNNNTLSSEFSRNSQEKLYEIELMSKALSANLREMKRFETKLLNKFPELKEPSNISQTK